MSHTDPLRFDGRTVLITGAGRGLGRAYARAFGERGAAVVLADLPTRDEGPSHASVAAAELRGEGIAALEVDCDVTVEADTTRAVRAAVAEFGRLDAVVNNAGTIVFDDFPRGSDAHVVRTQLDVHLHGALNMVRSAWDALVDSGEGRVVNTASGALLGAPGALSYGIAKTAVMGLSSALATKGVAHGIRVNTLLPSAETEMQVVADAAGEGRDGGHSAARRVALSAPEQCAPMVLLLSHEQCPANGGVFFNGRGTATQFRVSTTLGYTEAAMTPESLLANWGRVTDPTDSWVPQDALDFRAHFLSRVPTLVEGEVSA